MFNRKPFYKQVEEKLGDTSFEDNLQAQLRDAESLLQRHASKRIAPYEITIVVKAKTWRSILWQLAVVLDTCMRGPENASTTGASTDGLSYRVTMKSGPDVTIETSY